MKNYTETFQDNIDMTDGSAVIWERDFKAIQRDALLEAAEIINTRISLLETWGDDETRENIHIKEIRALRPVYDAILARAKGVEGE